MGRVVYLDGLTHLGLVFRFILLTFSALRNVFLHGNHA